MVTFLAFVGAACLLYGVAVMLVGSGTWFFAFWLASGAVALCASVAVQLGWWAALPSVTRLVVLAAIGLMFAVYAVTLGLQTKDFGAKDEPDLDFIVVLGAQVREDGPSLVLRYRLDAACDYLNANPRTRCIVSGGQGPNEPAPEADVMADYLLARVIDPARIVRERESVNTVQNIANSMTLLNPATDRVGIVTNNFHVFRSLALARKAGLAHVCGIAAPSSPFFLLNNMTRESLGITKDFLSGNL